jgi:hypothetical protein
MTLHKQIQWAEAQLHLSEMLEQDDVENWQAIVQSLKDLGKMIEEQNPPTERRPES